MSHLTDKYIDVAACKKAIANTRKGEIAILVPHYSINIQSKYPEGEELQWDLDELEDELGCTIMVNDFDDLIADPHGVMNDESCDDSDDDFDNHCENETIEPELRQDLLNNGFVEPESN